MTSCTLITKIRQPRLPAHSLRHGAFGLGSFFIPPKDSGGRPEIASADTLYSLADDRKTGARAGTPYHSRCWMPVVRGRLAEGCGDTEAIVGLGARNPIGASEDPWVTLGLRAAAIVMS
jgi:hypothetical protein